MCVLLFKHSSNDRHPSALDSKCSHSWIIVDLFRTYSLYGRQSEAFRSGESSRFTRLWTNKEVTITKKFPRNSWTSNALWLISEEVWFCKTLVGAKTWRRAKNEQDSIEGDRSTTVMSLYSTVPLGLELGNWKVFLTWNHVLWPLRLCRWSDWRQPKMQIGNLLQQVQWYH